MAFDSDNKVAVETICVTQSYLPISCWLCTSPFKGWIPEATVVPLSQPVLLMLSSLQSPVPVCLLITEGFTVCAMASITMSYCCCGDGTPAEHHNLCFSLVEKTTSYTSIPFWARVWWVKEGSTQFILICSFIRV